MARRHKRQPGEPGIGSKIMFSHLSATEANPFGSSEKLLKCIFSSGLLTELYKQVQGGCASARTLRRIEVEQLKIVKRLLKEFGVSSALEIKGAAYQEWRESKSSFLLRKLEINLSGLIKVEERSYSVGFAYYRLVLQDGRWWEKAINVSFGRD